MSNIITELSPDMLKGLHALLETLIKQSDLRVSQEVITNKEKVEEKAEKETTKRKRGRPPKKPNTDILSDKEIFQVELTSGKVNVKNKQNKFLNMLEFEEHKEDSVIDKKLWKNRTPCERPAPYKPVEALCIKCNNLVKVNPQLTHIDLDTKKIMTTCRKCSSRRNS